MTATDADRPKVKGVIVQHVLEQIHQRALFDAVANALPHPWESAVSEAPFATDWLDLRQLGAIVFAVEEVAGPEVVFEVIRAANHRGTVPRIQPIIDGIVRLFGLSPTSFLSRMSLIMRATTRGVATRWEPQGDHEGTLILAFDGPIDARVPWGLYSKAALAGWAGSIQVVFDVCAVPGRVEPVAARPPEVELHARW